MGRGLEGGEYNLNVLDLEERATSAHQTRAAKTFEQQPKKEVSYLAQPRATVIPNVWSPSLSCCSGGETTKDCRSGMSGTAPVLGMQFTSKGRSVQSQHNSQLRAHKIYDYLAGNHSTESCAKVGQAPFNSHLATHSDSPVYKPQILAS